MCYAIPGRVSGVKGKLARLDYFGEEKTAVNELGARPGEYVYAQGGFVVQRVPEKEALLILGGWREKFFQLQGLDKRLAPEEDVFEKAKEGAALERDELLSLLKTNDKQTLERLYRTANFLRRRQLKNSCCVHGIIEFSNHCRNSCSYCGIRCGSGLERYRMSPEEIIRRAEFAVRELGFRALVLQSGEDEQYTIDKLAHVISEVRKMGVLVFMSVGLRSREDYRRMWDAGARGVLLRFETSNPEIYERVHQGPKADFKERLDLLRYCKELGYLIATGSIIGLPGETEEDLLNDILLTKSLGTEMYSFGPLIPHPLTPMANEKRPPIETVLKVLAVSRLADPRAKILVTTALETLDPQGRRRGLLAGANSLMINVTPREHRERYEIYPGRPDKDKQVSQNIAETLQLLYSLGRAPTDLGL